MSTPYLSKEQRILIAGGRGMVGSAIYRNLQKQGYQHLFVPSREELDLLEQDQVRRYLKEHQFDVVVISAAKVGGIWANMHYPAEFIYDNLMIQSLLIHEAHVAGVDRLLFLGSSCIYPKFCEQPIKEEMLLTSELEPTNEAYAIAKIAGVKMCYYYQRQYGRKYISAMPTNLYGPGDNYHPENAHVIPALLRRFHEAKESGAAEVVIWGSGQVQREFLYVDDLAKACVLLLDSYFEPMHVNIGSPDEVTILELAKLIKEVVGFRGEIVLDRSKPDGTPRKKCDLSRISKLGWQATTSLKEGLSLSYEDFKRTLSIAIGA